MRALIRGPEYAATTESKFFFTSKPHPNGGIHHGRRTRRPRQALSQQTNQQAITNKLPTTKKGEKDLEDLAAVLRPHLIRATQTTEESRLEVCHGYSPRWPSLKDMLTWDLAKSLKETLRNSPPQRTKDLLTDINDREHDPKGRALEDPDGNAGGRQTDPHQSHHANSGRRSQTFQDGRRLGSDGAKFGRRQCHQPDSEIHHHGWSTQSGGRRSSDEGTELLDVRTGKKTRRRCPETSGCSPIYGARNRRSQSR